MTALDKRQQAFREMDKGVFNILKLALAYDMTDDLFIQVAHDIRNTFPPAARKEMLAYTKEIEIYVTGSQWRYGWWWNRQTHKHISVDITFNPYKSTLSAWTDPDEPDGIALFR